MQQSEGHLKWAIVLFTSIALRTFLAVASTPALEVSPISDTAIKALKSERDMAPIIREAFREISAQVAKTGESMFQNSAEFSTKFEEVVDGVGSQYERQLQTTFNEKVKSTFIKTFKNHIAGRLNQLEREMAKVTNSARRAEVLEQTLAKWSTRSTGQLIVEQSIFEATPQTLSRTVSLEAAESASARAAATEATAGVIEAGGAAAATPAVLLGSAGAASLALGAYGVHRLVEQQDLEHQVPCQECSPRQRDESMARQNSMADANHFSTATGRPGEYVIRPTGLRPDTFEKNAQQQ